MPTYEYRCPEGHESEDFVLKISDAKTEITCPTCGAVAPRRMSAGSGLVFKGSGFYITDYGKDGKKDQRTAAKSSDGATSLPAASTASGSPSTGGASEGSKGSSESGKSSSESSKSASDGGKSAAAPAPAAAPAKPASPPKSSGSDS
jgi:putative FmdB family regulatory protein